MTASHVSPGGAFIGAPALRHEDDRLVRGQGAFLDDVTVRDMLHVAFVRSDRAHARLVSVDTGRARALPGVVAAYSTRDLPWTLPPLPESAVTAQVSETNPYAVGVRPPLQYPLAREDVHYVGEPVAVVVARDRYAAADAVESVTVEYEDLPAVTTVEDALAVGAATAHRGLATNIAGTIRASVGGIEAAFAAAEILIEKQFRAQRVIGLPLETRGILVWRDRVSNVLTVYAAHQNAYRLRSGIAGCLGLSTEQVRVITPDVGGGFGSKGMVYPEEVMCSLLAFHLGAPIKWVETRIESFLSTNHARDMLVDARLAAGKDGAIRGLDIKVYLDCGSYNHYEMVLPTQVVNHITSQYRVPALRAEGYAVLTNKVQVSPYRGAGRPEAIFVIERLLDMLSRKLERDPADVRRRNLVGAEEIPYEPGLQTINGGPVCYDSGDFPSMFERALQLSEYSRWRRDQRAARERGRLVGIGLSTCMEGGGTGPCEGATIRVDETGKVNVFLGVGSQGQSHETVFAQVCAEVLGCTLEDVRVRGGDTSLMAHGFGTRASRVAVNSGNAVAKTAAVVKSKACLIAARLFECSADDIVIAQSVASVKGLPDRGMPLAAVARASLHGVGESNPRPGLEATEFFYPTAATWAASVNVAVVEVDAETGMVKVLAYTTVHDSGTPLNAQVVDGQVIGGIVQGIGATLGEEIVYDAAGQLLTGSLMDYAVIRAGDVPAFVVDHLSFPTPSNPLGVKGIGEGSVAGPPAAIANAVDDALGGCGCITRTPFTPWRVWQMLRKRREAVAKAGS